MCFIIMKSKACWMGGWIIEIVDLEGECINKDNVKKPFANVITERLDIRDPIHKATYANS